MSDGTLLNGDEASALLADSEEEAQAMFAEQEYRKATTLDQGGTEITPPATVALTDGSWIASNELCSVIYTTIGVFIVGFWGSPEGGTEDEEVKVLIPWDRVLYVQFDMELMVELLQKLSEEGDEQA